VRGLVLPEISDTVISGYCGTVQQKEGGVGNYVFFFSGLEAQGDINRLLDRLFGSND
jgi:hypothetical protein